MTASSKACHCGEHFPEEFVLQGGTFHCVKCGHRHSLPSALGGMSQATALVTPPPEALVPDHEPDQGNHTHLVEPPSAVTPQPTPPPASEPAAADIPESLGPYLIREPIGRGGMGTVYRAEDRQLRRDVAVKVLAPEYRGQSDFVVRFDREARSAASIDHRNIVQIYFTGVEGGIPFFGMEYVRGSNLQDVVTNRGALSPEDAIDFMIQAAEGLRAAAGRGVIHRDVKPTNLLLQDDGTLKIADFGLAKSIDFDSRLTLTGAVVGTPYYMAPEQGKGEAVDHRADIYALGASFYHLLTGDPPFKAESPVGIIVKHINEAPPPMRSRRSEIPPMLEAIIFRMMAKDPADRYPDYDTLIADLAGSRSGSLVNLPTAGLTKDSKNQKSTSTFVVVDAPPPEIHLKKAGIFRWLFATAIDVGLIVAIEQFAKLVGAESGFQHYHFMGLVAGVCTALFYFIALDARGGQTIGKALFRMRVGTVDGTELGFLRSAVRFVFMAPLILIAVMPALIEIEAHKTIATYLSRMVGVTEGFADGYYPDNVMNVIEAVAYVSLIVAFLDLIYGFLTGERRLLHDSLSGAYVFRRIKPKRRPQPVPPPAAPYSPASPGGPAPAPMTSGIAPPVEPGSLAPPKAAPAAATTPAEDATSTAPIPSGPALMNRRRNHPNPQYAAMLGLVPGLGQVYNGQFFRGLLLFALATSTLQFGVGALVWVFAIWHAYNHAWKIQRARDRDAHIQASQSTAR